MNILIDMSCPCGLRKINGRPLGVAPTASEQAALRSDFENKISHTLRCPSFSAKSHVCECLVFINAHIYAFAALPTFHGGSRTQKRLKIIKSRGVYVAFYSYMRVGNNVLFP